MFKKPRSLKKFIFVTSLIGFGIVTTILYLKFGSHTNVTTVPPLINKDPLLVKTNGRSPASSSGKKARRRSLSVIVKLKEGATPEQLEALKKIYDELDLRKEKQLLKGKAVRLKIGHKDLVGREEEVAASLQSTGAIEFAEPDYEVIPAFIPNDYYYPSQWNHPKVKSDLAWGYTQGSANVIVAVCDAGFDIYHPDYAPNLLLPGYNTVSNNGDVNGVNDHGTMSTGVLTGIGNNSFGVAGMAWNIKVLPIQISDQPNGVSSYSDVSECIQYAMSRGAKVVNISYDYNYTSALINETALAMRNAGGLVVTAAGNSTVDISGWGQSPMIVVGATDSNDNLAWFSNFGSNVDIFAPGLDLFSTTANNTYSVISGTSFATPVVSGALALLYSLNPSMTADQAESLLLSNASIVGSIKRLNVGAAVQQLAQSLDTIAPQITIASPGNGATVSGTVNVTANATDNVGVVAVEFRVDGVLKTTDTSSPYSYSLNTGGLSNGAHAISATAKDAAGKTAVSSININVNNAVAPGTIIIDNLAANISDSSRISTGTWCKTNQSGSYGTAALYSCGANLDKYRIVPAIPARKSYAVFIRFIAKADQSYGGKVIVKSASGQITKSVNMRKDGGTWVPLGTYTFWAGTANYVELNDSAGTVSIDAIKLEPAL